MHARTVELLSLAQCGLLSNNPGIKNSAETVLSYVAFRLRQSLIEVDREIIPRVDSLRLYAEEVKWTV